MPFSQRERTGNYIPYYYDVVRTTATNGSGATDSDHLHFLTVANQESAQIRGIYGSARSGTGGGMSLRLITAATPGSGGTAQTPQPRNSRSPAADLTVANDATSLTPGGTPKLRLSIGVAQLGGNGGWQALEPAAGLTLQPNGGANGNAELHSIANAASVPFDVTVEHAEGA